MTSRHVETGQSRVVLFVGHGTRVQAGVSEFIQFCSLVERRIVENLNTRSELKSIPLRFERAFLELAEPDFASTLMDSCTPDVSSVIIVPLFLFDAGHMKQDIPGLIQRTRSKIEFVEIELLRATGVDAAFIEAAAQRLIESGYPTGTVDYNNAVLLLGRGNKDISAQNEFEVLAKRVQEKTCACLFETGYLAGTGRDWRDSLTSLLQGGAKSIYIQPYLWFHGWLTEKLPQWIADWRQQTMAEAGIDEAGRLEIRVGEPLGIHPAMVSSVTERVLTALLR